MAAVYTPPQLPGYLANAFGLKPVIGTPTDEEVKLIHSVIRVVENAPHIPTLFNPVLSTELANHLFEVQMARYKSKYSFSIFSDITYTPPELPSHMNISLEPVVVAPTDSQIGSVQTALRFSESMASAPAMYDADLSMKLSQHLFDIQLARYVWRAAQVQNTPQVRPTPEVASVPAVQAETYPAVNPTRSPNAASPIPEASTIDIGRRDVQEHIPGLDSDSSGQFPVPNLLDLSSDRLLASQELLGGDERHAPQNEVKELLTTINQSPHNLHRTMIVTHNSMARQLAKSDGYRYPIVINSKGEDQAAYGIQDPGRFNSSGGETNLARLLQYFGIGDEFLEEGPEPSLKSGTSTNAYNAVYKYVYCS